jgi:hypothetical protein
MLPAAVGGNPVHSGPFNKGYSSRGSGRPSKNFRLRADIGIVNDEVIPVPKLVKRYPARHLGLHTDLETIDTVRV